MKFDCIECGTTQSAEVDLMHIGVSDGESDTETEDLKCINCDTVNNVEYSYEIEVKYNLNLVEVREANNPV